MEEDQVIEWGPYKAIADRCRLSERTIRTAFARKPVVYETACRIAKTLGIPVTCLRIKADARGQNKGKKK